MWKHVALVTGLVLASMAPADAQLRQIGADPRPSSPPRVEVSGLFGWTMAEGVAGQTVAALDGNPYKTADLEDSMSWGVALGVYATNSVEVGFLFGQQLSTLAVDGVRFRAVGDISVDTYHPYVAYNFGGSDSAVRPYLMIGAGVTDYGSVSYKRLNGESGGIDGQTKFSTTWGAGLKVFPARNFGLRFGAHWTPTYIKTDASGWWCDPYWGCYVTGDAQYSNQINFSGGVTLRF